jgi:hypothetical protein
MYDEKQARPAASKGKVQLRETSSASVRAALRGMDYAQGQAFLAPVVQRSSKGEDAPETDPETDKEKVIRMVAAFVDARFGGDNQKAFDAYATEGTVDQAAATKLLIDAGVKEEFGWLVFLAVPGKVMAHFDIDPADGKISQQEFDVGMKA